jgi:ABC-type polysaccharide transport system permease subunit
MSTYYLRHRGSGKDEDWVVVEAPPEKCWWGLASPFIVLLRNKLWIEIVFINGIPLGTMLSMLYEEGTEHSNHHQHDPHMLIWLFVIWVVTSRFLAVVYTNKWCNEKLNNKGYEFVAAQVARTPQEAWYEWCTKREALEEHNQKATN